MINHLALTVLLLFAFTNTSAQNTENQEPKSAFILRIDGQEYIMSEGEELNINNSVITVKLSPYRTFENEFISFNYPSDFGYDLEKEDSYYNWSFDGDNYVFMLFEIGKKIKLQEFVDEMVGQFGKEKCNIEKTNKIIGRKNLSGKRINVNLIGQKLTIDLLEIPSTDSNSRFLILQDILNEKGLPSEESQKTLQMINASIKFK